MNAGLRSLMLRILNRMLRPPSRSTSDQTLRRGAPAGKLRAAAHALRFTIHVPTSRPTAAIIPLRMGKQRIDWVDRLQYVGLRLVSMVMHSFPIETNLR